MPKHIELPLAEVDDSWLFRQRLAKCGIISTSEGDSHINPDVQSLHVNFERAGHLHLSTIGTLALLIRTVAQRGGLVRITWPHHYHGQPSRLHWFLLRSGFVELWKAPLANSPYNAHVEFDDFPLPPKSESPPEDTHYIKAFWVDRSAFELPEGVSFWNARPVLSSRTKEYIEAVLLAQGFAGDPQTVTNVTNLIFYELGWNTVLHSANVGEGFGVCLGQISHVAQQPMERLRPKKLDLVIADLGKGVPHRLKQLYGAEKHPLHLTLKCGERSGILRYSFYSHVTSRSEHVSYLDEIAGRGLEKVATAIMPHGHIHVISDGGELNVSGTPEGYVQYRPNDRYHSSQVPGVQVRISILQRSSLPYAVSSTSVSPSLRGLPVVHITRLPADGRLVDSKVKEITSSVLSSGASPVLLDFGFDSGSHRTLELVTIATLRNNPDAQVLACGVGIEPEQARALHGILRDQLGSFTAPMIITRFGIGYLLGSTVNGATLLTDSFGLEMAPIPGQSEGVLTFQLPADHYLTILRHANTSFISDGFHTSGSNAGFYTGDIRLLSGEPTTFYFSLLQNISEPTGSNLQRWAESATCAVASLLSDMDAAATPCKLIGFAASIRPLMATVANAIPNIASAHTLLTYDAPSREELAAFVRPGDDVILFTDVVSTGSLIRAVHETALGVDANVLGAVALVDSRKVVEGVRRRITDLPMKSVFTASMDRPTITAKSESTFEVNPITLVPEPVTDPGPAIIADVETTVDLIVRSRSAFPTHRIDGARHTSVAVDTSKLLLESQGSVANHINERLTRTLSERDWGDFQPSVILYPTGHERIERVLLTEGASPATTYATAVAQLRQIIDARWGALPHLEVIRVFEPSGRARCQLLGTASLPGQDMVIVDDGVWTGRTARELLRVAVGLQPKRILLLPLLSRLSYPELRYWEGVRTICIGAADRQYDVCFVAPLVLPIPYYTKDECPYESTVARFSSAAREEGGILAEIAVGLSEELLNPTNRLRATPEFTEPWLRLRAFLELASDSSAALQMCKTVIESASTDAAKSAVLTLFLEEWRLLSRPRIRQALAEPIARLAESTMSETNAPVENRAAAVSLLRSRFRPLYCERIRRIAAAMAIHPVLLDRTILHLATLPAGLASHRHKGAATALAVIQGSIANDPDSQTGAHAMAQGAALAKMALDVVQAHTYETEASALESLARAFARYERHHVWAYSVEELAEIDSRQPSLGLESIKSLRKSMKENVTPYIMTEILPPISRLHTMMRATTLIGDQATPQRLEYVIQSKAASGPLLDDLGALNFAMELLERTPSSQRTRTLVHDSARRIYDHVIADESTLGHFLATLSSIRVQDLIGIASDKFAGLLEESSVPLPFSFDDDVELDTGLYVQCDRHTVEAVMADIFDNVVRYAFPRGSAERKSARIFVTVSEHQYQDDTIGVAFKIFNNGRPLISRGSVNRNQSKPFFARLQAFGATLAKPVEESEPWAVSQGIYFRTWRR
jgi:orotate phosphoribosyltransferase